MTKIIECGTNSGYRRHLRRGEPTDEACRAAHNATGRAYRAQRRTVTAPFGLGAHTKALNEMEEWVMAEDPELLDLFRPPITMLRQFATMFDGADECDESGDGERSGRGAMLHPATFREWRQLLASTYREVRGFIVARAAADADADEQQLGEVVKPKLSQWERAMGVGS